MAGDATQDRFLGAILGMAIGDAFGMPAAMRSQAIVALVTIGVAFLLPNETRMTELVRRAPRVAPAT